MADNQPTPDGDTALARFGARVRARRQAQQLTQEDLAAAAGMDRKTVNRVEMGRHSPRIPAVLALAAALNAQPGELLDKLDPAAP